MAEERVQRRLAAILAADVVGYSRLMGEDEEATLRTLKAYREVIDGLIANHRGRVFGSAGDSVIAEFASPVEAVRCAIEIQKTLEERNAALPEDRRMRFRIGVNLGDVMIEGDNLLGDGVNVAARLEALAEPGGICVSGIVQQSVETKADCVFHDLGDQEVKNIARPVRTYRVIVEPGPGTVTVPGPQPRRSPVTDKPSIAVLPFENMSGDPEQEYFADGLTEDIITALSLWRSFPVIARNSTFTYKGKVVRVQQVAEELGAGYVLEGGVRKAGRRVRITAQLIDAETGHHVWAQKFDRDLEDIFAVQDEITRHIAATVVPELEKLETKRSAVKHSRNLDAWDCYLRGLSFLHESTKVGNVRAHEMFQRALELDPSYGPAFAGTSYILNRDLLLDFAESFDDTATRCLEAAERAVDLDDSASLTRIALVRALSWCDQHDTAIKEAYRALELNPYDALAHAWLGGALIFAGREEEGIPWLETALELAPRDPRNQFFATHLTLAYLSTGQPERALEWARVAAHRRLDLIEARLVLASVLAHLGQDVEARAALDGITVADIGSVERRPFWRRFRNPATKELVLDGLRKAGMPE